ncbi:MAG: M48 family peptidase [Moraxellaceae bacterium]|nr:MAG: M48 family peptidase [Moraxellaceae bacterium]
MQEIPNIQRRVKSNARRLKLRIEHHQVYLTIPPRTVEKDIQVFLKQSEPWLINTWNRHYAANITTTVPKNGEQIHFPLGQKTYQILLNSDSADDVENRSKLIIEDNLLIVEANQAGNLLKTWIRQQASIYLPKQLAQLANQYGFVYQSCQVRHAKTRWGSCSSQQSISLNAALLLLPIELVNYVLLHELCHTRQLNHSARFWQEMQRVDANYWQHREQLKHIKLPVWWHIN